MVRVHSRPARHPPPPRHERLRRRHAERQGPHGQAPGPHLRRAAGRARDPHHAPLARHCGQLHAHPDVQRRLAGHRLRPAGEGAEDHAPRHARRRGQRSCELRRRPPPPERDGLRRDGQRLAGRDPGALSRPREFRDGERAGRREGGPRGGGGQPRAHRPLQPGRRRGDGGRRGELRGERSDARHADGGRVRQVRAALLRGRPPQQGLRPRGERREGGGERQDDEPDGARVLEHPRPGEPRAEGGVRQVPPRV